MRKIVVPALGAVVFAGLIPLAAQSPYPPAKPQPLATPANSAARGAQLVLLGGCDDCHTPKLPGGMPDMARRMSGNPKEATMPPETPGAVTTNMLLTAWRGPWGLTLTRNLTPDKETGIGTWTVDDFKKTIRTGVDPKGQVIRPPMPIASLQNLPDQDLDAIFAFLKTLKPIHNPAGSVGQTLGAPPKPGPPKGK